MVTTTLLAALLAGYVRAQGYEPTQDDLSRYALLARAIDDVAEDPFEPVPFAGPGARDAARVLLLAIAAHESAGRAEVLDCRVTGDHGRAFGAFQIQRGIHWEGATPWQLCGDLRLQARLALHAAVRSRLRTRDWVSLVRGYATGVPWRKTPGSEGIVLLLRRWFPAAGVEVRVDWASS
jgi:hypothetical protein